MSSASDRTEPSSPARKIDNTSYASMWKSKRFFVMILLFLASLINYIDRVSMSVAAPAVAKEFGWDPATMGIVMSAFLWSYAVALVPMGWLTDKFGPKKLNTYAVSLYSLAAMGTGLATGFVSMMAARFALGAGEASTMPSNSKVVRQWFTIQERGLATALARSGAEAGPALGFPLVALLVTNHGWRDSFIITGIIGFVWVVLWLEFFRDKPEDCAWLSQAEKDYIAANTDAPKPEASNAPSQALGGSVIWKLLQHRTMWGLALSQGCIMYTQYLVLTWLPSYLMKVKGMELMKASLFSSFAFVAAWGLGILVCKISDSMLTPDKVRQGHRRKMVVVFMGLASIFVFTSMADSPVAIFIIITLVKTFLSSTIGLNMTLTNDLVANPAVAGSAFGLLLLGGNLFGSFAPVATGYIVKATGSFDIAFYLAGALIVVGAAISYFFTRKPIEID
jgi:sugar phosphate permease